jgi:hypothetical protein
MSRSNFASPRMLLAAALLTPAIMVSSVGCKSVEPSMPLADGAVPAAALTGTFVSEEGECLLGDRESIRCIAVLHLAPVSQRSKLRYIDEFGLTVMGMDFSRKDAESLTPAMTRQRVNLTIDSATSVELPLAGGNVKFDLKSAQYRDTEDTDRAVLTFGTFKPVPGHRAFAIPAHPAKSQVFLPTDKRQAMYRYIRIYESGRLELAYADRPEIRGGFYTTTVSGSGDRSLKFYDVQSAYVVTNSLSEDSCTIKIPGVPEPYEADSPECRSR